MADLQIVNLPNGASRMPDRPDDIEMPPRQPAARPRPQRSTSARQISIAERRVVALSLRRQGGSYRQIAEQIRKVAADRGFSPAYSESQAYRDVKAELQRLNSRLTGEAALVRRLELERLDSLYASLYPKAIGGDLYCVDRLLRIMEMRARLMGLNAPTNVRVGDPDGQPLVAPTVVLFIPDNGREGYAAQPLSDEQAHMIGLNDSGPAETRAIQPPGLSATM